MGDNNLQYNPRFFLKHHEFIKTTITVNDEGPNTMEMQFSIYGDPLPTLRNVQHDQHYSVYEIDLFKHCLTDLIVGHIFKKFSFHDQLHLEIFYHLKEEDRWVPDDSLESLSEELLQAMTGIFYPDMRQVEQTVSYKAASVNNEGMILILIKNELTEYNDFDEPRF